MLAVVQKLRRPVSEVCRRFDPLPQILKNVRYRSGKPLDNADVKSAIVAGEKRLNGHGRLLVRSSGTEPVIRVMGEGDDRLWSRKSSTTSFQRSAKPLPEAAPRTHRSHYRLTVVARTSSA